MLKSKRRDIVRIRATCCNKDTLIPVPSGSLVFCNCFNKFGTKICKRKNHATKNVVGNFFHCYLWLIQISSSEQELSFSVILHKPVCLNIDCTEFENHQSFETVSDLEIAVIAE